MVPLCVPTYLLTAVSSHATPPIFTASGVRGSKSAAQDQILIGMGSLAGSTVMLLSLLWGSCVIARIRNGTVIASTYLIGWIGDGIGRFYSGNLLSRRSWRSK